MDVLELQLQQDPDQAQRMERIEAFTQRFVQEHAQDGQGMRQVFTILDMAGRRIWRQLAVDIHEGTLTIDLTQFESGVYLIVLRDGEQVHTEKMSVLK